MPDRLSQPLTEKLSSRLRFYEDLGIREFFRDRLPSVAIAQPEQMEFASAPPSSPLFSYEASDTMTAARKTPVPLPVLPKILEGTLQDIREDIGDCIRCKLHKGRNKIVFGDGHPSARLLFIGEGPGRDEDQQGLPFVGRAGNLLTQMIEAMGLQRSDVYICNVVKCRPPENRAPEKDEVQACSPFLLRQIDLVNPQVIVCLGSIASQTILQTTRGITHFRGQWQEFRGRKLMATYHPAYLLRNPAAKSEVWKDLQKVMAELGLEVRRAKPVEV
jgi:uracil-DNA glycosylase family 4